MCRNGTEFDSYIFECYFLIRLISLSYFKSFSFPVLQLLLQQHVGFCIVTSRSSPVDTLFCFYVIFKGLFEIMGLCFFLDLFDLTVVTGFNFNFDSIILYETTCLVLLFFNVVVSSTFNKIPFVLTFDATRKISEPNRSHSKLSKTVHIDIISPTVLD